MSHEDAGYYATKHSSGTFLDSSIAELVQQHVVGGKITCAAAHQIASELQVAPAEVGITLDLLEIRISQCQLGLFGYGLQKRIVQPAAQVSPELRYAIEEDQSEHGLACFSAWELAKTFGVSRLEIAAACEALQVKIVSCQLGAF